MRIIVITTLLTIGVPAYAERDAELDALLGEAEATTQDEKSAKKALEPLFVIPFQPIWNSVEPDVVEEAFKHIAEVLKEDAGFEVRLFRQKGRLARGADPSARVAKKYYKEMAYAETLLKLKKPGQALRAVKPVLRKMWQNARHIRGSDTYCRCLAVAGEAQLRMGKKKAARVHVDELVTRCDGAFLNTTNLTYSARFNDMVKGRSAALEEDRSVRLTIHADLPKAQILLNGRRLGEAPLTITDLPKGRHLIGVVKKDHRAWGATPELKPGQSLELRATVTRGLENKGLRAMFGTLRDNRIDREVMRQATQMLRKRGAGAKLGVLGVLGRDGQKIRMTLFGFNRQGRTLRLKQADFGQDFLTVNLAMMGVAQKLAELKASGGRSLVAGEPLISGLRKGSWTPKERRWVSMRDDRRAISQQAAAEAANRPRGPLARRKKGENPQATPPASTDRIERPKAIPETKKPKDQAALAKAEKARQDAVMKRRQAKEAAAQKAEQVRAEKERKVKQEQAALAKKVAEQKAAQAEKKRVEREKRLAAWRARFGGLLSSQEWRDKQPSKTHLGIKASQQLGVPFGAGDLTVSVARRSPFLLAKSHWRYGLQFGLSTRGFDFSTQDLWRELAYPFLDQTKDSEDLAEAFRYEGSSTVQMGLQVGLDYRLFDSPLHLKFDLGMGGVARQSTIVHEQYILEDGERVQNTGIELRTSDPFLWTGLYAQGGLALEYFQGEHLFAIGVDWTDLTLRAVESFGTINFEGSTQAKWLMGLGYATAF